MGGRLASTPIKLAQIPREAVRGLRDDGLGTVAGDPRQGCREAGLAMSKPPALAKPLQRRCHCDVMRHSLEVVGPATRLAEPIVVDALELRRPRLGQAVELAIDGYDCEDLALIEHPEVLPALRIQANLVADSLHGDGDLVGNLQCPLLVAAREKPRPERPGLSWQCQARPLSRPAAISE
jgi:hypothetical protein